MPVGKSKVLQGALTANGPDVGLHRVISHVFFPPLVRITQL